MNDIFQLLTMWAIAGIGAALFIGGIYCGFYLASAPKIKAAEAREDQRRDIARRRAERVEKALELSRKDR